MFLSQTRDWLIVGLVASLLAACATTPEPEAVDDPAAVWRHRESELSALQVWTMRGRVALKTADDAWNASLHWVQDGDAFRIRFAGPFGQGLVQLEGDQNSVRLRTAQDQVYRAADAETLLFDATGWRMPVGGLRYWLMGRIVPGDEVNAVDLDRAGRPTQIRQSGWTIDYLRYRDVGGLDLPSKVFLEGPRVSARLVIMRWDLSVGTVDAEPVPVAASRQHSACCRGKRLPMQPLPARWAAAGPSALVDDRAAGR